LPGVVLFGFSLPWVLVGLTTLLQRLTPPELQGRVYAAVDAFTTTPPTRSIALGAAGRDRRVSGAAVPDPAVSLARP
jgi:hypothetical protein